MRKRRKIKVAVSIEWFNELVARYYRNRLLSLNPGIVHPWRHPWHTLLTWSEVRGLWTAQVQPAFCHSKVGDPEVRYRQEARHASAETRARLALPDDSDELVDSPLSEKPPIDLPSDIWRPLGTEAVSTPEVPAEAVPEDFQKLGVASPITLRTSDTGGLDQVIEGDLAERERARLLRAVDLVVTHERSRTGSRFTVDETTGGLSADVGIIPPSPPATGAKITRRRKFEPKAGFSALSALSGGLPDDGIDEIKVATLYLLSERGAEEGSELDSTWLPFAEHFEFWPLQYRERYERTDIEPTRLEFPNLGVGGGSFSDLAERLTDSLNDDLAAMEAAFNTVKAEGRFFTL